MSPNALYLLRRNITDLLLTRKESQHSLAFSIGHHKTWLNKFLNGDREIQFKDLDGIANFFGLQAYQLYRVATHRTTPPAATRRLSMCSGW
jgi:hypothetical protein